MANLSISKSSLKRERDRLQLLRRFLPSLDLKRKQLLVSLKQAESDLDNCEANVAGELKGLSWILELLGAYQLDLDGLVTIDSVVIEEENVVGARLPVAREVTFKTASYSMLAKPFWVDFLVEYVQKIATLRIHLQVHRERKRSLEPPSAAHHATGEPLRAAADSTSSGENQTHSDRTGRTGKKCCCPLEDFKEKRSAAMKAAITAFRSARFTWARKSQGT